MRASEAARLLGSGFVAAARQPRPPKLARVVHEATGLELAVVPGGSLEMGLRESDVAALAAHVAIEGAVGRLLESVRSRATPVRWVDVAPFVVTVRPLDTEAMRRLSQGRFRSDRTTRDEARELAHSLGLRLPSEPELEYLAREGGAQAFVANGASVWARTGELPRRSAQGLEGLHLGEWSDDDWHENYVGAPIDGRSWRSGGERGVYRGATPFGLDEIPNDLVYALAAYRGRGALPGEPSDEVRMTFRLAHDLPRP
jgi:formylglycine-generating enzyme required for sulfatase activity